MNSSFDFETAYEYGRVKLSDFGIFCTPKTRFPLVALEKVALLLLQFLKTRLNPDIAAQALIW